jgi:hypothetical protein
VTDCWLARFAPEVPCDGPEDFAHLIAKQRIKREVSHDQRIVWHPATFVRAVLEAHLREWYFPAWREGREVDYRAMRDARRRG